MWLSSDIECSLTYEELNGFDHADKVPAFWVDGINGLVYRIAGKGIVRFKDEGTKSEGLTGNSVETMHQCAVCGAFTYWFEISFLAPFCSPRCVEIMWGELADADIKAGPISV